MTEKIPGLMGFVARTLKHEPKISSGELYERSLRRYRDVADLSVRQFHARYALQAKRQLNKPLVRRFPLPKPEKSALEAAPPSSPPPAVEPAHPDGAADAGTTADALPAGSVVRSTVERESTATAEESVGPSARSAVRTLFFRLALDLETAPSRSELVDVISRIDGYVDEAMALARTATA